ncbi:MAG: hypothetical protein JWM90_3000 [Thermoleophilia bacterium]|nr:hypothetical protein [Thermoleophilia bacterium]
MSSLTRDVDGAIAETAWKLLGAVGMSTSTTTAVGIPVDVESALVLAAMSADGRLVEEARDWAVTYQDLIARPALKRRIAALDDAMSERWASFATPLGPWMSGAFPGAERGADSTWSPTRRTRRASIGADPAWSLLRYRAVFGTQARASVLHLLANPDIGRGWTADALARSTGYAKYSVREALDRLAEAGVVRIVRVGNADRFSAVEPLAIQGLAGDPGRSIVDASLVLDAFLHLRRAAVAIDGGGKVAGAITAHTELQAGEHVLGSLHLPAPDRADSAQALATVLSRYVAHSAERLAGVERALWPW